MSKKTRKASVMIVDDHAIVRDGLAALINGEDDLSVCYAAATGAEALEGLKRYSPDAAVVDLALSDSDGMSLIKSLKKADPDLIVLVLSLHDEKVYAERALRAGASGYINKSESTEQVLSGLRQALQGKTVVSGAISANLLQRMAAGRRSDAGQVESLSDRELQVFGFIASGLGTRVIAGRLGLSVKTVETYRENIKRKLELGNGTELVRYAVLWDSREKLGSTRQGRPVGC